MVISSQINKSEFSEADLKQHLIGMTMTEQADMTALVGCLRHHQSADIRATAAALLGELAANREGIEALGQGLLDGHYFVREMCAHALEQHSEDAYLAIPALIRALKQNTPVVKLAVLHVIRDLGPAASAAIPLLVALLNERSPLISQAAVSALGAMKSHANTALPALRKLKEHPSDRVRSAVITAIKCIAPTVDETVVEHQVEERLIGNDDSAISRRWIH